MNQTKGTIPTPDIKDPLYLQLRCVPEAKNRDPFSPKNWLKSPGLGNHPKS